jgi:hypothetical protein
VQAPADSISAQSEASDEQDSKPVRTRKQDPSWTNAILAKRSPDRDAWIADAIVRSTQAP